MSTDEENSNIIIDEQEQNKFDNISPKHSPKSLRNEDIESKEEVKDLKENFKKSQDELNEKRKTRVFEIAEEIEQKVKIEGKGTYRPLVPKNYLQNGSSSKLQNYHNQAVQLYKCDKGKYYLDKNAMVKIFSKVEDKLIAIYSICGKYRSGKSFMLANFLKYLIHGEKDNWLDIQTSESFKYKNCEERVTTGIWIWPEPIFKLNDQGQEVAIFLMDTQGWHDDKTSSKDNALVFALSAVLSSVMIFNAEKRIGEDDLQYFQCFTSTAKLIDANNKDEPFQKLIFLIRDWQFPKDFYYGYYDDHFSIRGKNFKKSKINPQSDQNIDASSIREIIMSTYTDIGAYLMPYPGSWIFTDEFSTEAADKTFVFHLKDFITRLFYDITPKKIGGKYVTGKELISRADDWAEEFKYVPNTLTQKIAMTFSSTDESHYLLAYQTSLDYFDEKMKKKLSSSEEINDLLALKHSQELITRQCRAIFYAGKKMEDQKIRNRYEKKLIGELDDRMNIFSNIIENKIILKRIDNDKSIRNKSLDETLETEESLMKEIEEDLNKLTEKFNHEKKMIERKITVFTDDRRQKRKNWFSGFIGNVAEFFGFKQ